MSDATTTTPPTDALEDLVRTVQAATIEHVDSVVGHILDRRLLYAMGFADALTKASSLIRASPLAALAVENAKLLKFKKYVHDRLNEAGVPTDPESPHRAEGCRIGGRLDVVLGENERLRKAVVTALEVIDALYDQQAMPDESARPQVAEIRAAAGLPTEAEALENTRAMRDAATSLSQHFGRQPWLMCVGVGMDSLFVYTKKQPLDGVIPSTWRGFKVEGRKTGLVRPAKGAKQ